MGVQVVNEGSERLPSWIGQEFGWDTVADVNWAMLRQNLKSMEFVLANAARFPKADYGAIEAKSNELFIFLASHLQS